MKKFNSITVRDLKEALDQCDDDDIITFTRPTHDHWDNTIAEPIEDMYFEKIQVAYSDYHEAFTVISEDDSDDCITVLSLNS